MPKVNNQATIGPMARQQLESGEELFSSLSNRAVSPRRFPTNELLQNGLQRFVRVEKPTQAVPATGSFPRTATALNSLDHEANRLKNLQKLKKKDPQKIERASALISGIKADLLVASGLTRDQRASQLQKRHESTSKGSPFLSGTLAYTQGPKSQADHVHGLLKSGTPATITISHTDRAALNPFNPQERESLLPIAEHSREVVGTYTMQPDGTSSYVDTSGDAPKTYDNAAADAMFAAHAGSQKL